MKPQAPFNKLVKEKQEKLIGHGFKIGVLRSWMYGYRLPNFENAIKLSNILDLPISQIPYRRIEVNRP